MDHARRPVIKAWKDVKGVAKVAAQKLATSSGDGMRWVLEALKKPGPAAQRLYKRLPFVTAPTQAPTQALTKEDLDLYARHRDTLYPDPELPDASKLEKALRAAVDGNDSYANRRLNKAIRKDTNYFRAKAIQKNANKTWRFAVKKNREDLQRAVLLLRGKELHPGFRFDEKESELLNPGITRVMREFPQFSRKWDKPENLNFEATFGDTGETIKCRHLATTVLENWQRSGGVKTDFSKFKDVAAIKQNMGVDNDGKFNSIWRGAEETHLIHNEDFGKFIAQQFEAMENRKTDNRQILVNSTTHTMALGLRIKSEGEKNTYVVQFFDPNVTNNSARSAMGDPKGFEAHGLSRYIPNEELRRFYYPESQDISMMYVVPPENDWNAAPLRVSDNRVLSRCIEDDMIDTHAMFHLMDGGFAGELRRLTPVLAVKAQDDAAEVLRLLQAKRVGDTPGFLVALQNGHAATVRAFGNLLLLVPKNERAGLLAATRADGVPGLQMALVKGHANAVEAFGTLLPLVPKNELAGLLEAKNADGVPGLYFALKNGHTETIRAYVKLLLLLDRDEAEAILFPPAIAGLSELEIDDLYKPAVDEYLKLEAAAAG